MGHRQLIVVIRCYYKCWCYLMHVYIAIVLFNACLCCDCLQNKLKALDYLHCTFVSLVQLLLVFGLKKQTILFTTMSIKYSVGHNYVVYTLLLLFIIIYYSSQICTVVWVSVQPIQSFGPLSHLGPWACPWAQPSHQYKYNARVTEIGSEKVLGQFCKPQLMYSTDF